MPNGNAAILVILLLITSGILVITSSNKATIILAQAKKSSSSSHHTKTSTPANPTTAKLNRLEHIPDTTNFQAVSQSLITAANNDNAIITNSSQCNSHLNDFILPAKEARFIILNPCITVSGMVVWTNYFNEDGDANFNIILDPQYKNMLGPGQYNQVFFLKYHSGAALHVEVPCQGPVASQSPLNVGACNGYDGPNFKPILPHKGQHVMVTGRYLIEPPEIPGGITEIHPVTAIKILQ